ncbi:MAG: YebC/PmpR family DNA-binding transcriptional regulator [Cyanobacteria bacterium HKST-UBA06]|nr:YebC/PmpR family DNA-binding transcriptional regulator [Cyanobacteria bacterium HKST-UBA05]MCA9798457.1 YebC/PmpR family DNA-binding transcriptional regulator [Cyanobacteria bacterium HKST-UBA04]MCA9806600.1 YebC/PmpR family DNA-binding transcriptional regulator [Cyanobacteria bacterium HKST-UBA06]MCA9840902.1 YebC/PmpR family DNA-binding transcriptional regulator [Cyanobacteria bacterium HKST-UBA03]
MAGHSKWANIKHRKAAQDAKKGQAAAKYCRAIMQAAKLGGADPEANFRLRTAIDKAKSAGVNNDTIDRAVQKGAGLLSGDQLEDMTYEGYGPGGVAVFIEAMTDNKNRTAGDVRSYFNKYGGNLGSDGCVAWMFVQRGEILINTEGQDEEQLLDIALNSGAEDVHVNDTINRFEIWTPTDTLNDVCQALRQYDIPIESAETTRVPENTVKVDSADVAKPLLKLLDALESQDDVQQVYANFDMDDELLESCTS